MKGVGAEQRASHRLATETKTTFPIINYKRKQSQPNEWVKYGVGGRLNAGISIIKRGHKQVISYSAKQVSIRIETKVECRE